MNVLKIRKRMLSLILVVAMVFTAGIEWTSIRSEAAFPTSDYNSYKMATTNISVPKYKQRYADKCAVASLACVEAMAIGVTGNNNDAVYWGCWAACGGGAYMPSDGLTDVSIKDSGLIYNKVKAGVPVLAHFKTSDTHQHWIVFVGYDGSGSSINTNNFVVMDPARDDAAIQKFSTFCSDCSFSWNNMDSAKIRGNGVLSSVSGKEVVTKYSFSSMKTDEITEIEAKIHYRIDSNSGWNHTCDDIGFIIGLKSDLSDGKIIYESSKNGGFPKDIYGEMFYSMNKWYGTLKPGTKYYWQAVIKRDNCLIKSQIKNFKTTGTPVPELKSLVVETGRPNYYNLRIKLKDNTGVKSIVCPTWTKKNGTDDYVLGDSITSYTKNNNWVGRIKYADHGNEAGPYITDIYAYDTVDTSGNGYSLGKFTITVYKLSNDNLKLFTGDSNTLTISPAPNVTIKWTSDDESIAKVNSSGKVTAVKSGSTLIRGTYTVSDITYEARCTVTVSDRVNPTSLTLSKTTLTLEKDKTASLSVIYKPDNTTEKGITWKSDNTKVATVDKNGKVTAVAKGTATITATSSSASGVKATCKVTVTDHTLTDITLSKTSLSLEKGSSETITVSYTPSDTNSSKTITWTTSDSKVATVDKNGKVTAVAAGKATITATSAVNGVKAKTCEVTVTDHTLISIALSKTSLSLEKGNSETLSVSYTPSDTNSSKAITWTTSDDKVATVDKNGKVTAVAKGTATITATSAVKGVKAVSCKVTVTEQEKQEDNTKGKGSSESGGNNGNDTGNNGGSNNGGNKDGGSSKGSNGGSNIDSNSGGSTNNDKSSDSGNGYVDRSGSPSFISGLDLSWETVDGKYYWYEGGFKQGTYNDPKGVMGTDPNTGIATNRGREICDNNIKDANGNGTWFWLDSVYDGARAVGKEVWMPYIYQNEKEWASNEVERIAAESDYGMEGMGQCVRDAINKKAGKWVRYDGDGKMMKGWIKIDGALAALYPSQQGNEYYYDTRTGLMAKGKVWIDGVEHYFDETTGVKVY